MSEATEEKVNENEVLTETESDSQSDEAMALAMGLTDDEKSGDELEVSDEGTGTEAEAEQTKPETETSEELTEPEPAKPEPKMVPLAALQESRERLRELRDDPDALKNRLRELEGEAAEYAEEPERPPVKPDSTSRKPMPEYGKTDESDPDPDTLVSDDEIDYFTPSQLREHERKRRAWEQRENQRVQKLFLQQRGEEVFQEGRRRFNAEVMGENLDYRSVLAMGSSYLTRADQNEIDRSADPAKTSYELCVKRCPGLRAIKKLNARTGKQSPQVLEPTRTTTPVQNEEPPPSIGEMVLDANDRTAESTVAGLGL